MINFTLEKNSVFQFLKLIYYMAFGCNGGVAVLESILKPGFRIISIYPVVSTL